ncbi:hypothetical protein D3C81_900620 [compost metagenome]
MLAAIEIEVMLAGQLVRCVGRQRRLGRVFVDRGALAILPVDRRTGGEQHALNALFTHGLAQIEGADEVALVGRYRVIHRSLHRRHSGQMRHRLAAPHRFTQASGVGDIAFEQLHRRRQILALAGGQVVQHPHLEALCQQGIGQMRADEAGAAGDEDRFFRSGRDISHDDSIGPVGPAARHARRAA